MRITAGELRGRTIRTLAAADGYRPATARVREAVFNMLAARGLAFGGLRVADLFAGSGSLGLEALSRGAAFALFVDANRKAAELVLRNLRDLGIAPERYAVQTADVRALARKPMRGQLFGLVFVDPPYGRDLLGPSLELAQGWLAADGILLAETETSPAPLPEVRGLDLELDRTYGQTRISLWRKSPTALPSTPEPSTP